MYLVFTHSFMSNMSVLIRNYLNYLLAVCVRNGRIEYKERINDTMLLLYNMWIDYNKPMDADMTL